MSGSPIKLAVGALKLFLHSLPIGSKFNVVSFGSDFTKIFPQSVVYNEENLKIAVNLISSFDADMGGTEILEPLKDLVSVLDNKDLPRCLYLLTDGAVSNTEEVVNLIRQNNQNCSVNTFGIGSGADESLIKNSAKAGRGHFTFIYELQEIETKVIEALTKDFYEYLTVK
jgi:von Willebrand factor A domain-containing protein 5